MYQWQPGKWLQLAIVGVGLPYLASAWLSTDSLVADISTRAAAALGGSWATLKFDGRDATLSGQGASQDVLDTAIKAVQTTYGVRTVNSDSLQLVAAAPPVIAPTPVPAPAPAPEPVVQPLVKPTLAPIAVDAAWPHVISGTWPEDLAKTLTVGLAGITYQLGKNAELTSDGKGNFTLQPPADLKPGSYDLDVNAADDKNQTISVTFPNAVVVPAAAPLALAAPTVSQVTSDKDRPTVSGTWPAGSGNNLQVELDGVTHTLGKDADLQSDSTGNWSLTPDKPVVNGTYDVIAKVTAPDGQSSLNVGKGALTVAVAAPPPAPPPAEPYDCEGTLARISAVFPIHFEFDHSDLSPVYQEALKQYSTVLNDPRCTALKLQVAGHADFRGSAAYNQALSERRAQTVTATLAAEKVDPGRLTAVGFGSSKPLDMAHTDDARAKNRRAEFSVLK